MLEMFFTLAFSSVPLILYFPPMRSFNLFVETIEETLKSTSVYTNRVNHGLRGAWSRVLNCVSRSRR
ncbi:hypothetical protein TanjilG_10963 [Lupinus angustifolius]|uniref:Uncharacterized protein n=1 Tax=Lupinus angustifolius TaxID=3871 RepID=A0A1J7IAA0_LUPAN|nr:hypothetical protein TanjilG_10959 [Lupinus angustifolius]OIW11761.1 hypothetical protein TanjilG_10963 [Lupinus angustifolius]